MTGEPCNEAAQYLCYSYWYRYVFSLYMQTLYQVIKEWPSDLYNAKAIIYAVNVSWCMYHFTFIRVSVADGYRIYSNRSRTPNSSRSRIVAARMREHN